LVKGATNRSYGIQVASLAGVPQHVITRAYEILKNIELGEFNLQGQPKLAVGKKMTQRTPCQLPLFTPPATPLVNLLASVNLDEITPRQALDILYQAKHLINNIKE
jgi:DNA mismatch repair protein MutS